jgi:hypothetical protein
MRNNLITSVKRGLSRNSSSLIQQPVYLLAQLDNGFICVGNADVEVVSMLQH